MLARLGTGRRRSRRSKYAVFGFELIGQHRQQFFIQVSNLCGAADRNDARYAIGIP
jgi:hypothetical protein